MTQHDAALRLLESIREPQTTPLNEATTRARIIDTILYDVLSWPKNAIVAEEHNREGFCDYVLKDLSNETALIIEAKKEGAYFEVPVGTSPKAFSEYFKIRTLRTDPVVASAIDQVRSYCLETGTKYGCITNGNTWVFFTAFSKDWENLNGFVIRSLEYFTERFTEAYNQFGYENLVKRNSLSTILERKFQKARVSYSTKEKIKSYTVPVDLNIFAQYLSKPIKYYFGDLATNDSEFVKHCYVDETLYKNTKNTLESLFIDNVSPYLANHGVIDYERDKLAKKLSKKITNFLEYSDNKHIVIIYGDRGSGKSTFIRKLIYFDLPQYVRDNLNLVYINLLDYAAVDGDRQSIRDAIWRQVLRGLDSEGLLKDYDKIERHLFQDELGNFRDQLVKLYGNNREVLGKRTEEKIGELLSDNSLVAQRLAAYQRKMKKKEIVLVLDNTDQYSAEIQDFCFQLVSEIFSSIKCLSIITIREERFFRSKNLGVLDAYETTQYHIASPQTDKVFIQRLSFLLDAIDDDAFFDDLMKDHEIAEKDKELVNRENFKRYLIVFKKDFDKQLNLYSFLYSCAQKNIRKALDMFRELLFSGYMNVNEIISVSGVFTLQVHQVLKPLMTPKKYFYEEESSSVPNLYKIRHPENGSHFTLARILNYLNVDREEYVSLAVMKSKFIAIFGMEEDFDKTVAVSIYYKLVESNIKVDTFIPEVESIRITPYGLYFLEKLAHSFTYLDLISTDCHFYDEGTSASIARSANEEFELFDHGQRGYRMIRRVQKTNQFLDYLKQQEAEEGALFGVPEQLLVTSFIDDKYRGDILTLKKSALRQYYVDYGEQRALHDFFESLGLE